jgi:hypothetical protein
MFELLDGTLCDWVLVDVLDPPEIEMNPTILQVAILNKRPEAGGII